MLTLLAAFIDYSYVLMHLSSISLGASVLQLSHDDCDGGAASQREDIHLQEANSLPELDRGAHKMSVTVNPVEIYEWDKKCFMFKVDWIIKHST